MGTPVTYDEPTRAIANQIVQRLQDDVSFREAVKQDPTAVLTGAGLPAAAVGDFLGALKYTGEVAGYMRSEVDHCNCFGWPPPSTCMDGRVTIA